MRAVSSQSDLLAAACRQCTFHLSRQLPADASPLLGAVDDEKIYESFRLSVIALRHGADASARHHRIMCSYQAQIRAPRHDPRDQVSAPVESKFLVAEAAEID